MVLINKFKFEENIACIFKSKSMADHNLEMQN